MLQTLQVLTFCVKFSDMADHFVIVREVKLLEPAPRDRDLDRSALFAIFRASLELCREFDFCP